MATRSDCSAHLPRFPFAAPTGPVSLAGWVGSVAGGRTTRSSIGVLRLALSAALFLVALSCCAQVVGVFFADIRPSAGRRPPPLASSASFLCGTRKGFRLIAPDGAWRR
ncbi:MAG TPA: hypothetical protein VH599_13465 [Ktedonobacterales bacterium]